jgi:phosphopantothenoylcysteine decarboxylase/phosphopantothenate--cysteine ligase
MWSRPQYNIEHIELAAWAEAATVAPATANFLAKMAHGLADDFASTFLLAFSGPTLAAPAMNNRMLSAPATRNNLKTLTQRGVTLLKPDTGLLACGEVGAGRLAEIDVITLTTARALTPQDFAGRAVAVSAGSTWESWDDIRFLANRSTGRMGRELALAAWLRGARVTLIAGPTVPEPPTLPNLIFIRVESTCDLLAALKGTDFDTLIMAAAPADFRPAHRVTGKVKKKVNPPALTLATNPDILKTLPRWVGEVVVGFAAEDDDLVNRARAKLADKNLDLVVANQAGGPGGAFGSPNNHIRLIFRDGTVTELSPRPKFAVAWAILEAVATLHPRTTN